MQRARSRIWSRNASSWGISSCFTRVRLFVTLWTIVCWAPLSKGFSRQEYWRGLPCRPSGDLRIPGIKPESPVLAGNFFTTSATWEGGGISPKSSCQGVTCRLESQCRPQGQWWSTGFCATSPVHTLPDPLESLPWAASTFHCPQKLRRTWGRPEVDDEAPWVFACALTSQRCHLLGDLCPSLPLNLQLLEAVGGSTDAQLIGTKFIKV